MDQRQKKVKAIALYLPQFHSIPENDRWWGEGFTEWTNVKKAKPFFKGHYQPHIPLRANYYNLTDIKVMEEQAALARKYDVYGFCFYHYWFNGKLLLEKPLHDMLQSGRPNFPFCLSWANENWTRRWDGAEHDILMQQNYSSEDDLEHIKYLIPFFKDQRYIKINNRPIFYVYRSELHPNIKEATKIWRNEVVKAGFDGLYLIRMENFQRYVNPEIHGFDAGSEFAPDAPLQGKKVNKKNPLKYIIGKLLYKTHIYRNRMYENIVVDYNTVMANMLSRSIPNYTYFRSACPSWDNASRKKKDAHIYINSSPQKFEEWINRICNDTIRRLPEEERIILINAWNEWGEGCHLEPDEKYGYAYLEALKNGLK